MIIKDYIEACHKTAVEKGFYDKERNVGEVTALIISELMEGLEGHRKGDMDNLAEEIADALIRLFDFCGGFKVFPVPIIDEELTALSENISEDALCDLYEHGEEERKNLGELLLAPIRTLSYLYADYLSYQAELSSESKNQGYSAEPWLFDCHDRVTEIVYLLLYIAKSFDLNVIEAIDKKMQFNTQRPYKHGKAY